MQAAMLTDYGPRAVTLLEQIRERGKPVTGIDETEIADDIGRCSVTGGSASYWGIQKCAERLAIIVQKMH